MWTFEYVIPFDIMSGCYWLNDVFHGRRQPVCRHKRLNVYGSAVKLSEKGTIWMVDSFLPCALFWSLLWDFKPQSVKTGEFGGPAPQ